MTGAVAGCAAEGPGERAGVVVVAVGAVAFAGAPLVTCGLEAARGRAGATGAAGCPAIVPRAVAPAGSGAAVPPMTVAFVDTAGIGACPLGNGAEALAVWAGVAPPVECWGLDGAGARGAVGATAAFSPPATAGRGAMGAWGARAGAGFAFVPAAVVAAFEALADELELSALAGCGFGGPAGPRAPAWLMASRCLI